MEVSPIEFNYRRKTYYALIRKRCMSANSYHVKVINSTLDKVLSGNDILVIENNGNCYSATCVSNSAVKELVDAIIRGVLSSNTVKIQ